ncbi:MAG: TolC family protein [Candidatus Methanofishera endochildressiae]|uniref:TolC family protein n=1 Tax=Candidatus Methanofishera endochildressiae TaxID=2738884 RepID=A0A7Z0MNC0_9GAMM|nr:TolC family protein [Candidatus Methanofishera endochildressiae]
MLFMFKQWIADIIIRMYQTTRLMALVIFLLQSPNSLANESILVYSGDSIHPSQLLADILKANPQMEVVQAVWEASTARAAPQSAWADPQFRYTMAPLTIGSNESSYGQRFELSQHIYWPGKLRLRGEVAEHQANAQYENIAAVQLVLTTTAKSLFADWYYIHQAIKINNINQGLFDEFRKNAVTRYGTGLASKQDALRADVERNLLKHQAIVLHREQQTILARMNTLLNRSPEAAIPPPHSLAEIKFLPELKSLRAKALQSRPELKAMLATIDANETQVELAELEYYPDFNVSAGYNSLWDNEDKRFTIGVGFNLPLGQGKREAREQEARAKMKQARWQKSELEARIKEELHIAYARVEESLHVLSLWGSN